MNRAATTTCSLCGLHGCAASVEGAQRVSSEVVAQVRRALVASVLPDESVTDLVTAQLPVPGWAAQARTLAVTELVADVAVELLPSLATGAPG